MSPPSGTAAPSPARSQEDARIHSMSRLFAALSDPTRLKLVLALYDVERGTTELANELGVSVSAVSHQLRSLKDLDLVRSRREGRHVYHHIADLHVEALIEMAREHVEEKR